MNPSGAQPNGQFFTRSPTNASGRECDQRGERARPLANTQKWKMTITPTTGAYSGSFELQELTESRTVNFSGVLRQTPTLSDNLIGAGHYMLPALKTATNNEQTSGALLFWRPE